MHPGGGRVHGRDEAEERMVATEEQQRPYGAQIVALERRAHRLDVADRQGEAVEARQRADDLEHLLLLLDRNVERRDAERPADEVAVVNEGAQVRVAHEGPVEDGELEIRRRDRKLSVAVRRQCGPDRAD